ncbi:hypothetical protein, partial [Prevotella sp.]|uniref:hypothetical protein n=1 Tax=Prevotella sp. TaxID=59823 RepID=UPI00307758E1
LSFFPVIPLGFKPKTFRTFSQPDLSAHISKKESQHMTLLFSSDPVGIQTQDLQNFFSTRSFCSYKQKGEPTHDSPFFQ